MANLLRRLGQSIGMLGILLMLVSLVLRLAGEFWVAGFATGTLMVAGIGAVCLGSFLLLCWVSERRSES
jgi:hypothetical protein